MEQTEDPPDAPEGHHDPAAPPFTPLPPPVEPGLYQVIYLNDPYGGYPNIRYIPVDPSHLSSVALNVYLGNLGWSVVQPHWTPPMDYRRGRQYTSGVGDEGEEEGGPSEERVPQGFESGEGPRITPRYFEQYRFGTSDPSDHDAREKSQPPHPRDHRSASVVSRRGFTHSPSPAPPESENQHLNYRDRSRDQRSASVVSLRSFTQFSATAPPESEKQLLRYVDRARDQRSAPAASRRGFTHSPSPGPPEAESQLSHYRERSQTPAIVLNPATSPTPSIQTNPSVENSPSFDPAESERFERVRRSASLTSDFLVAQDAQLRASLQLPPPAARPRSRSPSVPPPRFENSMTKRADSTILNLASQAQDRIERKMSLPLPDPVPSRTLSRSPSPGPLQQPPPTSTTSTAAGTEASTDPNDWSDAELALISRFLTLTKTLGFPVDPSTRDSIDILNNLSIPTSQKLNSLELYFLRLNYPTIVGLANVFVPPPKEKKHLFDKQHRLVDKGITFVEPEAVQEDNLDPVYLGSLYWEGCKRRGLPTGKGGHAIHPAVMEPGLGLSERQMKVLIGKLKGWCLHPPNGKFEDGGDEAEAGGTEKKSKELGANDGERFGGKPL